MEQSKPETKAHKPKDEAPVASETPKPVSSLDLETSARSKRFLKASVGPAVMGLISAALLVAVVALYNWGITVSSNSTNGSSLALAWNDVLPVAAILLGLVVSIGLPVLWAYKKGFMRVVTVLALEGVMLLLVLVISGFFLFSGSGTTSPPPVGCGCGGGGGAISNICMECAN